MKIMILNGPNINMLGIREKSIYGNDSYESMLNLIQEEALLRNVEVDFYQSNHEGDLVDLIQKAYFENFDGLVINPAAYTHTSIAIGDAIKAIAPLPVVEVHLSKISEREEYRQISMCSAACIAQIQGEGVMGYIKAIDLLISRQGANV